MPLPRFVTSVSIFALALAPVIAQAQETEPRLPQIQGGEDIQASADEETPEAIAARLIAEAQAQAAAILEDAEETAETRRAAIQAEAADLRAAMAAEIETARENALANAEAEAAAIVAAAEEAATTLRADAAELRATAEADAASQREAAEAEAAELMASTELEAAALRAEAERDRAAAAARLAQAEEAAQTASDAAADSDAAASATQAAAAAMVTQAEEEAAQIQTRAEAQAAERVAAAEVEATRILEEARAAAVLAIEEERARIAAEEEAARLAAEEAARIAAEEAARAAAEAALAACLNTAGMPDAGVPVSEDAQAAALAAVRAAEADCALAVEALPDEAAPALFHLATLAQTSGEHREAIALYEEAVEAGIVPAQTRLGDYYLFGTGPIRPDFDEAAARYAAAAEGGDPAAQTTLGFLHLLGRGVDRDPARMLELMGQAADQGYHFAQFRLAQTYLTGEGIPERDREALGIPDVIRAAELFEDASASGNADAALILADLYAGNIEGLIQSDEDRFRWTERAANTGDADALAALAFLIERGTGTDPDPNLAAETYIRALEEGVSPNDLRPAGQGWDYNTAVAFQLILSDRGLYDGAIDGIVGAGTLAGARALGEN